MKPKKKITGKREEERKGCVTGPRESRRKNRRGFRRNQASGFISLGLIFPLRLHSEGILRLTTTATGTNCAPGGDIKEELHPRITSPLRRGNAGERERDWGGRGVMIGTSGRSSVWNCNGGTRAMGGTQNKQAKKERVAGCVISVRDWLHGHAIRFPFTHLHFHLVHFSIFISFLSFLVCLHPIC